MPAPTTPKTPTHGQFPPGVDSSTTSPSYYMYDTSPGRSIHSRKSSLSSTVTPRTQQTPDRRLSLSVHDSARSTGGFAGGASGLDLGGNGLGSLADELADAWDEDGEGNESMDNSRLESQFDGCSISKENGQHEQYDGQRVDQSYQDEDGDSSPTRRRQRNGDHMMNHANHPLRLKHRRQPTQRRISDADDGGGRTRDADDSTRSEFNWISPSLEARLADIERLAQLGVTSFDGGIDEEDDLVVGRLLDDLRDLGGQAKIEDGTSRLVTTHMNLTNQLTQHTRALHSLAYPLFFSFSPLVPLHPLATEISNDDDDDLIALLNETSSLIPRHDEDSHPHQQQPSSVLSSLTDLSSLTTDLIQTLNYLSDTVHMSRQTTTLASRTLRSARAIVAEITREQATVENSIDWIERGDWQARLARRDCQAVCKDVLDGFDELCRGWTERVVGSTVMATAGAGAGAGVESAGTSITKSGAVTPSSSSYSSISTPPSIASTNDTQLATAASTASASPDASFV